MAIELFTKEALLGFVGAVSVGLNGWMAFGRYWLSSKASNANDKQQINMLQFLSEQLREAKNESSHLRDEIEDRDKTIREYWKTISETDARLQIIEGQQRALEEQNESLKREVHELTTSNMNLIKEITQLRTSLEVPR